MPQALWATPYGTGFFGIFSTNPADATKLRVSFQVVYTDTTRVVPTRIENDVIAEITIGQTPAQIQAAVVAALKARGATIGFNNITIVLIPSFTVTS